jgi:hypothetical protein
MDQKDLSQILFLFVLAFILIIIHLVIHPILVQILSSAITSTQHTAMYSTSEKMVIIGLIYLIENIFLISAIVDILFIIGKISHR